MIFKSILEVQPNEFWVVFSNFELNNWSWYSVLFPKVHSATPTWYDELWQNLDRVQERVWWSSERLLDWSVTLSSYFFSINKTKYQYISAWIFRLICQKVNLLIMHMDLFGNSRAVSHTLRDPYFGQTKQTFTFSLNIQ